ncbi:MAG: M48 family metallopeptidase [Thermovirgaceae bacterium]|nr:M48 family metallopeptidase [Thermovirgaceae bacterium]
MRANAHRYFLLMVSILLLLWLSPASFASAADADAKEIKLGEKVSKQIEEQWERVVDPVRVARLSMIMSRLLPFTERDLPFEVRLIEEKKPNAFALPGGRIYFTTGMLEFCRSDDEVAAVMAHELIHADKRHVMIQVARNQRLSLGALAILIATKGQGAAPILASLAQVAIMNSYGRDLEREADTGGLNMLDQTGYVPAASVTVMERLLEQEIKHPYVDPGIFAGHPKTRERVADLVGIIRDNGWPLERKKALHLLRTAVSESEGLLSLTIDGLTVWLGPRGPGTLEVLNRTKESIDKYLQMESSPFDVMVLKSQGAEVLKIGLGTIAAEEDVLPGMPSLSEFREKLLESLHKARSIHPVANYHS